MRTAIAIVDAFALLVAVACVAIAVTGGGTIDILGHELRAHSVGNPLLFLVVWAIGRYPLRNVPLLGRSALPLAGAPAESLKAASFALIALNRLTARRALTILVCVVLWSLALKAVLAIAHPGFFSGDDVELHEMTFNSLFGTEWPIWDLRSAFYPMSVLYPVQRAALLAGVTDMAVLVVAARLVVVVLSSATIVALYLLARRENGQSIAVVAAILLASSALHAEFGATELPRPVAALFVVGAYACLTARQGAWSAGVAGVLLGIAACFRFSEVVFIIPACVHLAMERRWSHASWMIAAFVASAGSAQAVSDYLYWGEAFRSARAVVDFTLVQGLSSRGYDPWWYYAREATSWSDVLVLALAVYGTRRNPILAMWVWVPIVVLSMLSHKEPRYLVPVLPFLCLLAAQGLVMLLERVGRPSRAAGAALAVGLAIALPLRFIDQASKYHVTRSDDEVAFARRLAPSLTASPIMVEHAWRFGGHLYLGWGRRIAAVGPDDLSSSRVDATLERTGSMLILVSARTCEQSGCASSLERVGFVEHSREQLEGIEYRLFRRSDDIPLTP